MERAVHGVKALSRHRIVFLGSACNAPEVVPKANSSPGGVAINDRSRDCRIGAVVFLGALSPSRRANMGDSDPVRDLALP